MTENEFKIKHSDLIQCIQCIEYDLKRIYAGMIDQDFYEVMNQLENKNLGEVLELLKALDNSDGKPYFLESEYKRFDEVRRLRNYWCHKCFLKFVFTHDAKEKNEEFQRLTRQLENDYNRIYKLSEELDKTYLKDFAKIK